MLTIATHIIKEKNDPGFGMNQDQTSKYKTYLLVSSLKLPSVDLPLTARYDLRARVLHSSNISSDISPKSDDILKVFWFLKKPFSLFKTL